MKSKVLLTAILFILAIKAARAQAPTMQATNVTFSSILATSVAISWIPGNGTARAVFVSKGSAGSPAPLNNITYNANAAFGSGDQIGSSGWYCVYNGPYSGVGITGLTKATTYNVMVVEYNGSAFTEQYLTTAGTGNPATVMTTPPPSISYITPQTYTEGVANPQLVPTSRNVGDNAYAVSIAAIGSGFSGPTGVARDAAGNVYVADYGDKLVKKIPVGGGSPVIVGSGFSAPIAVAVDRSGNLYVADYGNHSIVEVPVGGGSQQTINSNFNQPTGVAVDGAGNVYVADAGNNAIYELPAGSTEQLTLGSGYSHPSGVAVDGLGNIYIADTGNKALKEIPIGYSAPYIVFDTPQPPYGVALDPIGDVFVSMGASGFGVIEEYILAGNIAAFGYGLSNPGGITIDGTGKVYVADQGNNAVKEMTPGGGYFINRALPTGLSFDTNTGIINGIPTTLSAPSNYIVTMYNSAGSASATVNIAVLSDNANLTGLKISRGALTPALALGTTAYTATVGSAAASITLTPVADNPNSTILVNNAAVTSGSASDPIPLNVGANTITILVTAPDGVTTTTYTLTVTRTPSTNANLSLLQLDPGTKTPVFMSSVTSYTATVASSVTSITVTPTTTDPNATVTVNNLTEVSGLPSGAFPLAIGPNVITTVVTAQDGITTKTYTVTVTRTASADDLLSLLKLSAGTKSPVFRSDVTSYTANVSNGVSSITVTPTATDQNAMLLLDGTTAIASGGTSGPIPLAVGPNAITVQVTAPDGVTNQTYTVTVTRAASGVDSYPAGVSVAIPIAIGITADDGIVVHQGVSPNGDGINDFLQIDNISQYPDNKLMIMNRNGEVIYEANGYDNSSKVFDGHSNKNGQMQLPGTYFYQLDYAVNGITKHKTGFLVLKY